MKILYAGPIAEPVTVEELSTCPYCGEETGRYVCPSCRIPAKPLDEKLVSAWIVNAYRHGEDAHEKRYRWVYAEIRRLNELLKGGE